MGKKQSLKKCETKEVNRSVADSICYITDECAALPEDADPG